MNKQTQTVLLVDDCFSFHKQIVNWATSLCNRSQLVYCFTNNASKKIWCNKLGHHCVNTVFYCEHHAIWNEKNVNIIVEHHIPTIEQLANAKHNGQTIIIISRHVIGVQFVDVCYSFRESITTLPKGMKHVYMDGKKEECAPFYQNEELAKYMMKHDPPSLRSLTVSKRPFKQILPPPPYI